MPIPANVARMISPPEMISGGESQRDVQCFILRAAAARAANPDLAAKAAAWRAIPAAADTSRAAGVRAGTP